MFSLFKTLIIALASILLIFADAKSQIIIVLAKPPLNQLKSEHLWKLQLNNPTPNTYKVFLTGSVTERTEGTIFEARSSVFELPPGIKNVTIKDLGSISIISSRKDYEEMLIRTGTVKEGDYEICVTAINDEDKMELGKGCITQNVMHMNPPVLVSPENNKSFTETEAANIVFTWLPPTPAPRDVKYSLKIVEVLGNQSPTEAMQRNPTWFEKGNIQTTTIQYPISARKFENGKKYAWGIEVDAIRSEIQFFQIITIPIIPCKSLNSELNVSLGSDGRLTICGTPGADDVLLRLDPTGAKIEVDNLSNGAGTDYSFEFAQVRSIDISLGAGGDRVIFDDTNGSLGLLRPLKVDVADGDNTVIGSTGRLKPSEIADLGNTIKKLKKVLETAPALRERAEKLARRAAEIAATDGVTLMQNAERFKADAQKQLDSLTEVLRKVSENEMALYNPEEALELVRQMEQSALQYQEKTGSLLDGFDRETNDFSQRLERLEEEAKRVADDERRVEELEDRMESEINSFTLASDKFPARLQEGLPQVDSSFWRLQLWLAQVGDTLLAWSDKEILGGDDSDTLLDDGDTLLARAGKELLRGGDSLLARADTITREAEAIDREAKALLDAILAVIGKLGEGTGTQPGPKGGCNFTTTNTITGSGLIIGTAANDDMTGGSGTDYMFSLGGSDRMRGGDGDDFMCGDLPFGSPCVDDMYGDGGVDIMFGGNGDDCMDGGAGTDIMWGDYPIFGGQGNDEMYGYKGQTAQDPCTEITIQIYNITVKIEFGDLMWGNAGNDAMFGSKCIDLMWGDAGDDIMRGDDGMDFMFGNTDDDQMWGEAGGGLFINNNQISPPIGNFIFGNTGKDQMWGGINIDFMYGNEGNDAMNGGDGLFDFMWGNNDDDAMNGEAGIDFMWGDQGDDKMWGDDGTDFMFGNRGNDAMNGGDGFDWMEGNQDDDAMNGDAGTDLMWGNRGNDVMHGNNGMDGMCGGRGNDKMWGDDGMDVMCGNRGNDVMNGGPGMDWMWGNQDDDTMNGNDGMDIMFGNRGNDKMWGDDGSDFMCGNQGDDEMWGGAGKADFMWGNRDNDKMWGGPGIDFMFGNECNDLMWGDAGTDVMFGNRDDDKMWGGTECDWMQGDDGDDCMDGGLGDDWMFGDDPIIGSPGNDVMHGGPGIDNMFGNQGNDVMDGGPGFDIMWGNQGNDQMFGGPDNDAMCGDDGDDYMDGNDGNDWMWGDFPIIGNPGNDVMFGGNGNDEMSGNEGDDCMDGGDGKDHMFGNQGNDRMFGGPGDDKSLFGISAGMFGNRGNDCMDGGNGEDKMWGNRGNDILLGRDGDDVLRGGNDDDILDGGPGSDWMFCGQGNDQAYGGPGTDWGTCDSWDGDGSSGQNCTPCVWVAPPPSECDTTVEMCDSTATSTKCDLKIEKKVQPSPLVSGQQATITITVTNVGTGPCPGPTTVTETVPNGLTLVSASGPGWVCAGPVCTYSNPIPANGSVSVTYTFNVTAPPPGTVIDNCATVNNQNDQNPANNRDCIKTDVDSCKCGRWDSTKVTFGSTTIEVSNGGTVTGVTAPQAVTITPNLKCVPLTCPPSYTWTYTGPTSGSGTSTPFQITPTQVGTYNVVVKGICGTQRCDSVRIFVKVLGVKKR